MENGSALCSGPVVYSTPKGSLKLQSKLPQGKSIDGYQMKTKENKELARPSRQNICLKELEEITFSPVE